MTNEELDTARAKEAWRIYTGVPKTDRLAAIAARLAREGWTPPEPVEPDVLAFKVWVKKEYPNLEPGKWDDSELEDAYLAKAYLAGARMARAQERERAKGLVEYVEADARRTTFGVAANAALAAYERTAR